MRTRSYRHLSAEARETLDLGPVAGHSLRWMARVLGRAPSTVSREMARNAGPRPYQACTAHTLASARARQPRRLRKLHDPWLWPYVQRHLREGYSPEQIAGRLRRAYPDDMRKQLLPETIYAGLYVLPRLSATPLTRRRSQNGSSALMWTMHPWGRNRRVQRG